jgi:hypothetical protein
MATQIPRFGRFNNRAGNTSAAQQLTLLQFQLSEFQLSRATPYIFAASCSCSKTKQQRSGTAPRLTPNRPEFDFPWAR